VSKKEARPLRSRLRNVWLLSLLAMLGLWLVIPASAQAEARFTVEYCDPALPSGNPPPSVDYHHSPGYEQVQTCAIPGGALGIAEPGLVEATSAWSILWFPETPGGFVEDLKISAYASNLQPGNGQSYVFTPGWPESDAGDMARYFPIRGTRGPISDGASVSIVMRCSNSPCNGGGMIVAHYIAMTQVDLVPPVIPRVEGPLLDGGVLRGHQRISALAGDVGGGVSRLAVLVNGLPAAAPTPGACGVARVANTSYQGLAATSPTPCPPWLPASWELDTSAPPFHDGDNSVQVCASDLATTGIPNGSCTPLQTVNVDNRCVDSPVAGGQTLSANFTASGAEAVTVPFGQAAEVTGELANSAGEPVVGATICVQAQTEGDPGKPAPIATATTDASGHFSYEVPAGPNRRLLIGYRHDSFQIGHTISFNAHSKPSLRVRPGRIREGRRVRITGSLPGPAAAGRVVVLQASALHGRRWLTFRRATTGPAGGFRATYRFGKAPQPITYRMRAVVPPQSGYPYAAGRSKPKLVKVHPIARPHHQKQKVEAGGDHRRDLEFVAETALSHERIRNQLAQTEDRIRRAK